MIGLTVLAVIAIYIGVFAYIVVHARNRAEKIAAIVVALAIPFWDLPFGYFNFYHHCSQDGGLHISKDLPALNAILIDPSVGYRPEDVLRFGFKTVEYANSSETIRYTADASGLSKSIHSAPISPIKIQYSGNQMLPWNLIRSDYIVSRVDNGQVIARQTDFKWRGLWWQVSAAPLLGSDTEKPLLAAVARNR